ncbi:MAG: GAF domain-containing protein, partial [Pseudomonadota bacterium]
DGTHLEAKAWRNTANQKVIDFLLANPTPMSDQESSFYQAIHTRAPVHILDARDTDRYRKTDGIRRRAVDDMNVRTMLQTPLFSGDQALGLLSIYRDEVLAFTPDEISMVEAFAAQAVIAIENAHQFRELQSQLDREAVNKEILRVISESPDDEQPVFDFILENARRLCKADVGAIVMGRTGGGPQEMVAATDVTEKTLALYRDGTFTMEAGKSNAADAILERRIIQDEDLSTSQRYLEGDPRVRHLVDVEGIRTNLYVPLISKGEGIGCLILWRTEVRPYTEDQKSLVETFAAQAVIAVENSRQFRALQTRLASADANREILELIRTNRDDDQPVFETIARNAVELCGAQFCMLWRHEGDQIHYCASHGFTDEFMAEYLDSYPMVPAPNGIVHKVITTKKTAHLPHAQGDGYVDAEVARQHGYDYMLGVPVETEDGIWGTMVLAWPTGLQPRAEVVELLETFAAQAVIAIENTRQFREVQTRLEREAASKEILQVISRSRGDAQPVFELILRVAIRLCRAEFGLICDHRPTDTHVRMVASQGLSPKMREMYREGNLPMDPAVSLHARAMLTREVVHVDVLSPEAYPDGSPYGQIAVQEGGVRATVQVPMLIDDRCVGALVMLRKSSEMFSEDQIALLQTFAAQAAIAVENVRQFQELQTRLEREAASRKVLEVISQSRDDEGPVFDTILEQAAKLCKAPQAGLILVSEDRSTVQYKASWGPPSKHFEPGVSEWSIDSPIAITTAVREARVVNINDTMQDDPDRQEHPDRREILEEEQIRSILAVPLIKDGVAIGCFDVYRLEVDPFTENDINLLQSFAAQAVIAIDNVRQFRELQTRLEREAATREILSVISQSRDDDAPVFKAILDNAQRLCGAPFGILNLVTEDGGTLEIVAEGDQPFEPFRPGWSWPIDSGLLVTRSVREGAVLQLEDAALDPLYGDGDKDRVTLVEAGVRTVLTVPLTNKGKAMGSMALFRTELRPYAEDEVALVQTFAEQAVIAIENVRQFRELQSRLKREAATSEILGVISQSREDDAPVFKAILQKAAELCESPNAWLILVNNDRSRFVIAESFGEELQSLRVGEEFDLASQYQLTTTLREGRTTEVLDLADTQGYRDRIPIYVRLVEEEKHRTRINVPLIRDGVAIGCIVVSRQEVRRFAPDEVALLETFAAQAVIAIDNARQLRELQTRLEREEASRQILDVISQSSDDDRPVFETIMENAARLCKAPHAGMLLRNAADTHLELLASNAASSQFLDALRENPHALDNKGSLAVEAVRTMVMRHIH